MSDATPNPHNTFVDSVVQRLETAECEDSHGKPIGGMTDLEKGVMLQFILQMAAIGSGVTRIALNLPAGVRKHVVLYAGILHGVQHSLSCAQLQRRSRRQARI
jgi:hypothetical protein